MELVMHNLDLVREILQWLPAKSLVKFRSVCRNWLFLISSTAFKQQHTLRSPKLQQSLILQTTTAGHWFHLNLTSRRLTSLSSLSRLPRDMFMVQSSNGLLLLQSDLDCLKSKNYYLYVHNPATRQSRKIIPPPSTTHPYILSVALAFDPSKSPYYRVVCFRSSPRIEEEGPRLEVYSSESHNWKELALQPSVLLPAWEGACLTYVFRHRVRVNWNNAIYWSSDDVSYYFFFDFAKVEMKLLSRPHTGKLHCGQGKNGHWWCLQESNGHLFHVEVNGEEETVAVWELGDDDQWLLRQEHHVPGVRWEELQYSTSFIYLIDMCRLLICRDGWMRVYNLNTGSYEDFLDATDQPSCFTAVQFGGTLALV